VLEVIAGIDHNGECPGGQDGLQASGQLGAADPAGQGDDLWGVAERAAVLCGKRVACHKIISRP
jgi:hypothetical protein